MAVQLQFVTAPNYAVSTLYTYEMGQLRGDEQTYRQTKPLSRLKVLCLAALMLISFEERHGLPLRADKHFVATNVFA